MRLLIVLFIFGTLPLQATILKELHIRIKYESVEENDTVIVRGDFRNHFVGDNCLDPDYLILDTLVSGESRIYSVQAPPVIIAKIQIGEDVPFPLVFNNDGIQEVVIKQNGSGTFFIDLSDENNRISEYIKENWILPGLGVEKGHNLASQLFDK